MTDLRTRKRILRLLELELCNLMIPGEREELEEYRLRETGRVADPLTITREGRPGMTDREIDLLVLSTINKILKHITFDEEHGMMVAQPAIDALRDAIRAAANPT